MKRLVAGCMTGTSIDALDVALVEIEGEGLSITARFREGLSLPLGGTAAPLRALAEQRPMTAGEIARVSRDFALLHAAAIEKIAAGRRLDLICIHGQTVFHSPPLSWQLFNPAPLAHATGAPVVFDLRTADLAAEGEGAPITPMADWVLFRRCRPGSTMSAAGAAVVNLGGFVNITLLPACGVEGAAPAGELELIRGGDVCTCNQLLDAIARAILGRPYDEDGAQALRGTVHDRALEELAAILARQSVQGRSLGTGDEAGEWIERWRAAAPAADLAATACEGIAQAVGRRAEGRPLVLAGGGVRNRGLRRALESCCAAGVSTTDELGVPAEFREAVCFGVLGALCQDRVPITLPQITGVRAPAPVSGCWMYP
jgi:anhydro-N-acetylmuramic acid kinase